jgi:hypothetical protein
MTPVLVGVISLECNQGGLFRKAEPAESIAVELVWLFQALAQFKKTNLHNPLIQHLRARDDARQARAGQSIHGR